MGSPRPLAVLAFLIATSAAGRAAEVPEGLAEGVAEALPELPPVHVSDPVALAWDALYPNLPWWDETYAGAAEAWTGAPFWPTVFAVDAMRQHPLEHAPAPPAAPAAPPAPRAEVATPPVPSVGAPEVAAPGAPPVEAPGASLPPAPALPAIAAPPGRPTSSEAPEDERTPAARGPGHASVRPDADPPARARAAADEPLARAGPPRAAEPPAAALASMTAAGAAPGGWPRGEATLGLLLGGSAAALLGPAAALYHRLARGAVLRHPRRRRVYGALLAAPGRTAADIAAEVGASYNAVRHHLDVLARHRMVTARRAAGKLRWFPAGARWSPTDQAAGVLAGAPGSLALLRLVAASAVATQREAVARTGLAKSTVSHRAAFLVRLGLLAREGRALRATGLGAEVLATLRQGPRNS